MGDKWKKNLNHVFKKVGTPCEAHRQIRDSVPGLSLTLVSWILQGREIFPEGI